MIQSLEENKGGIQRLESATLLFQEHIQESRMVDVDTFNRLYTRKKIHGGKHQVAYQLNHFFLSELLMVKDLFVEVAIFQAWGLITNVLG